MSDPKEKRSVKDRVLDRMPVFGTWRRLKGWMRRKKGWVYFAIVLLILFIVRPVLTIVAQIFTVLKPLIAAIFNNPAGRFVFYNLLGILLLWWLWRRIRAGVLRAIGLRKMRHFLDGMNAMIMGRFKPAITSFEAVAKTPRWVKLEDAVHEHRDIRVDAYIKIAACYLRLDRPNDAKNWLLRIREQDILTEHVRRNHAELRALSYDLNDEMEAETVVKELEKTQLKDRGNRRVLLALRERHEVAGDHAKAREIARKLVAVSVGVEREEAERDLALLEFRTARQALTDGDRKTMLKALKAHPGDVRAALMLGDLALEEGNTKGALKAWSRAVSLPVFERILRLLDSGKLAADKERDLLLKFFPYAGTLIVLAEHHRGRGEPRKARAALEKVLEHGASDISVLRLYAACLEDEGDAAGAAELYRKALTLSLS